MSFFSHLEDSITSHMSQKTMRSVIMCNATRESSMFAQTSRIHHFLATGEFVKFNSLNNEITSLCGPHWARQANYSKWLCGIPQTESAIHVITVWYSTFCKMASYNFIDEKQYSDS